MTVYPVPLISKPGIVYWVHDADDITHVAKLAGDKRHNIAVLVDPKSEDAKNNLKEGRAKDHAKGWRNAWYRRPRCMSTDTRRV